MIYIVMGLNVFIGAFSNILLKKFRQSTLDEKAKDAVYYIINITAALIYFGALSKYRLSVNLITLLFALFFSFVCCMSLKFNMLAVEKSDLIIVNMFSTSGSIIWPIVWGIVLFKEKLTLTRMIAVLAIIGAVLICCFAEKKKTGKNGLWYCFMVFLISGINIVTMKLYNGADNTMSESIFCFYTNIFMLPYSLSVIGKSTKTFRTIKLLNSKKALLIVTASVLLTQTNTLISMFVIKNMDLIVYSILSPSLSMIVVSVMAAIAFGEKITKIKLTAMAISVIAVVFSVI